MSLRKKLSALTDIPVEVFDNNYPPDPGEAPAIISFGDGTKIRISYWRLIKNGKAFISSFDHRNKYGLSEPLDSITTLRAELDKNSCTAVQLDEETGDLILYFDKKLKLQVFNVTGYEIWEIAFPDGAREYSNYVFSD